MKVVLVTGSRRIDPKSTKADKVRDILHNCYFDILIHGAASGVDSIAARWATKEGLAVIPMPAKWRERGRAAGPERNVAMLDMLGILQDYGHDGLVMGFPDDESIGTKHCIKVAHERGFPVEVYSL